VGDKTKIEWTDATWNPLRAKNPATGKLGHHCVKISPACAHCYAATMNKRFGTGLEYSATSPAETLIDEEVLLRPFSWKRPRKIFVCSMTDLFGDWVSDELIDRVFAVIAANPRHTFQVLTKRAERMAHYMARQPRRPVEHLDWPLQNACLGVTVEDQERADERVRWLLETRSAVRFLSCEPQLGPIDLTKLPAPRALQRSINGGLCYDALKLNDDRYFQAERRVDWVIVGGESGTGARPMHPQWARSLRDQCVDAGVPFFFKQWGEYVPLIGEHKGGRWDGAPFSETGPDTPSVPERKNGYDGWEFPDGQVSMRVGKKYAGRLLDGRTWDEFPQMEAATV
jgi:protein gp37